MYSKLILQELEEDESKKPKQAMRKHDQGVSGRQEPLRLGAEFLKSQGVSHCERHQIDCSHPSQRTGCALPLGELPRTIRVGPSRPEQDRDRMPAMPFQDGGCRMIARDDKYIGLKLKESGDAPIQLFQRCHLALKVAVLPRPVGSLEVNVEKVVSAKICSQNP